MSDPIAQPAFVERKYPPNDAELTRALGSTRRHWDQVLDYLEGVGVGLTTAWKFYGATYGWQLKIEHRRRALVYLIPRGGHFRAALALDDKAVEAVRDSRLSGDLVRSILAERKRREGRAARIDVVSARQVQQVRQLLAIKLGL